MKCHLQLFIVLEQIVSTISQGIEVLLHNFFIQMIIHDGPSTTTTDINTYPYNIQKSSWGNTELLQVLKCLFILGYLSIEVTAI